METCPEDTSAPDLGSQLDTASPNQFVSDCQIKIANQRKRRPHGAARRRHPTPRNPDNCAFGNLQVVHFFACSIKVAHWLLSPILPSCRVFVWCLLVGVWWLPRSCHCFASIKSPWNDEKTVLPPAWPINICETYLKWRKNRTSSVRKWCHACSLWRTMYTLVYLSWAFMGRSSACREHWFSQLLYHRFLVEFPLKCTANY